MAVGLAPAVANALLDALANQTNYTAPTALWIKLHIGDPGAAGTANPAVNTTRKDVTAAFPVAASGICTNNVDIVWSTGEVTGAEDYSHYSVWSASTSGTFYWSGVITANAVVAGDQFKILSGALSLTFTLAA